MLLFTTSDTETPNCFLKALSLKKFLTALNVLTPIYPAATKGGTMIAAWARSGKDINAAPKVNAEAPESELRNDAGKTAVAILLP